MKPSMREFEKWITTLICAKTGAANELQCCHIRMGELAGIGRKPEAIGNCVPLHWLQHRKQHDRGERQFWGDDLAGAKELAARLGEIWGQGGERERAIGAIINFRAGR